MEQEVNCSRRRCVRQNRVQIRLKTQKKGRRQKNSDVEDQNNVTNLKQVTAATDEQRGDFCSIQNAAATNCQPNAGADEEPAEDCGQQFIRRHVWVRNYENG